MSRVIALVGNPNSGKTTLFNALTGSNQRVGNWPGVTVERKTGHWRVDGQTFELLDLPGTYALDVTTEETSMDEQIAQQAILSGEADLYINVVDASNLERNLFLTSQLREMGIPVIVALNMMDVVQRRGLVVDLDALSSALSCPVVPVSASRGEGVAALGEKACAALGWKSEPLVPKYGQVLQQPLDDISNVLALDTCSQVVSAPWLSLRLLEQDHVVHERLSKTLKEEPWALISKTVEQPVDDLELLVSQARYQQVSLWCDAALKQESIQIDWSARIDNVVLSKIWGIPIFLGVMYFMFMFSINIGSAFIDMFDGLAGVIFVDGVSHVMNSFGSPGWLTAFVADGVGGGLQLVASFIPVIGAMFLFLSWLEDSGYMARAAFVMDRVMRQVGLPGKAFVPLIVGFGCNVPAIMATRTLEKERDRITAILMAPFMSCGARLSVYALFASAFFPTGGHNMVFLLYLTGILIAILSALVMKKTLLKGESGFFMIELPKYHRPTLRNVLLRTWERLKGFLLRAGKAILIVVIILNVVSSLGTDGSWGNQDSEKSMLSSVGKSITPLFGPMGLTEENWPATVGIFTGLFAKEVVVGSLDSLYSQIDSSDEPEQESAEFSLADGVLGALKTVPENLSGITDLLLDPLGLSAVSDGEEEGVAAEAQGVDLKTFGAMQARFDGKIGAFSYLLFVLLYIPCVATIGAIYRELNAGWTTFISLWTLGSGYGVAVVFYQAATWARHPMQSAMWIVGIVLILALVIKGLRMRAAKDEAKESKIIFRGAPS